MEILMSDTIPMHAIGHVRGGRAEPIDDAWDAVTARIELDPAQFKADAAAALDSFSHVGMIFHFDTAPAANVNTSARHPRRNKDWPLVGIFAQRGKDRPNRLGVT